MDEEQFIQPHSLQQERNEKKEMGMHMDAMQFPQPGHMIKCIYQQGIILQR